MWNINNNTIYKGLKYFIKKNILILKSRKKHLVIGDKAQLHNVVIGKYNTLYQNVEIYNSQLNDFVYISKGTIIHNTIIGKYCSIGPDVKIGLGKHPTDQISTFPAFYSTKRQCQITFTTNDSFIETEHISIGNDVWIGANVIIMDGVTIGDGVIVAAGTIVTKNIAPYSIVGGIPSKLIRKRFSEEKICELVTFKWWDKDDHWLIENHKLFHNPDSFFDYIKNKK